MVEGHLTFVFLFLIVFVFNGVLKKKQKNECETIKAVIVMAD